MKKLTIENLAGMSAEQLAPSIEHSLLEVINVSPTLFWLVSSDWRKVIYASPAFEHIYGYPVRQVYEDAALWYRCIHPDDVDRVMAFYEQHHGQRTKLEYRIVRSDNQVVWVRDVTCPIVNEQGELTLLAGLAEDVTESKQTTEFLEAEVAKRTENLLKVNEQLMGEIQKREAIEKKLKQALSEKELLLREIHHRVKNNLQVISGLIELNSRITNPDQLNEFKNRLKSKIDAIALIHARLLTQDSSRIDLDQYVDQLLNQLSQIYGQFNIKRRFEISPISVSYHQIVPLGLVINEIFSNTLKHAFGPDKTRPLTLTVTAKRTRGNGIQLTIADDGSGFSNESEFQNPSSLGMRLIKGIVNDQLKGRLDIDTRKGVGYTISFKSDG